MSFYQATKNPRSGSGGGFMGALNRDVTDEPKGFYGAVNGPKKNNEDLSSIDGLLKLAKEKGVVGGDEIAKEDKLSFLQRLSAGLGAFNPAEAILDDYEGTDNFLASYGKGVVQGIASALTGNDYGEQTKRRYFGDVVEAMGVENKVARFGLGLVGDILLDPSTYFGGTLVRGAAKGIGITARVGKGALAKVAPATVAHLDDAGRALKAAAGELFVFGYGASKTTTTGAGKGLAESFLEFEGKKLNVQRSLAISNAKRFGNDVLTGNQWDEFLGHLFKGKQAEFNYFDTVTDEMVDAFNTKFPNARFPLKDANAMKATLKQQLGREASDIEVRSAIRNATVSRLESAAQSIPAKIGKLQALRDKMAQPFIANDLIGLKSTMGELRKELAELVPTVTKKVPKGKPFMATEEQISSALMNALGSQKEKYTQMILDLEARIAGIESGVITPVTKQVVKEIAESKGAQTSDEILQQVMRRFDPTLKIKDKIVEINDSITKLTNDMFMKQHILENVLAGKQIAKDRIAKAVASGNWSSLPQEVADALNPVIKDPTVAKAVTDRLARNAKVAAEAGIEDPFHFYAPSIAKDVTERQRIQNFFSGTKSVKLGSADYTKEFKNLLKDSELLKDRSLFLRVEDEVATNKITQEFLDQTVAQYGKPLNAFKTEREAAAAGYKVLKDKGIFGKEIGYVLDADWKFLNSHINGNFKALDAIAKASGFDAATSLFKRFVTGIFAPFHVRNFASGEIQNFEILGKVAQSPKVQATGLRLGTKISQGAFTPLEDVFDQAFIVGKKVAGFGDETIELGKKVWNLDDIGRAIESRFGGSSRYNVDFNKITEDASALMDSAAFSKESLAQWGKSFVSFSKDKNAITALVGQDAVHFKAAQAVGAWIEMQQKSKLVIGALSKGMSMDEALDVAAKGGFDYRALTQFESKVMRRIIPFYSFNRKNLELQLRTLGTNPQRINQIIRSVENIQYLFPETHLTKEEQDNLPAYLKEYLSTPVGRTKQGVPQFVRNFGTPIEAFTELVKFQAEGKSTIERTFLGMLSKVNPYIKVPIELGVGKDSFRQRDIKEVYTAPEYEIAPQFLKDYLQLRKVVKKDSITGLPRTTFVADPERLLIVRSLFTSRGFTYFTNVFNGNLEGFLKIMDLASGIRVSEVDVERQAGFNERRKIEELGDLLRRNGVLSEFNKLFIPKK